MSVEEVDRIIEKENSNTSNKIDENNDQVVSVPAKRYSTRSSINRTDSAENGLIQRKKSDAPRPKTIPQFIDYKGKVEYFTEFFDIAFASDNLL